MDEVNRIRIVSCVDIILGIVLVSIGFVLLTYGYDWGRYLSSLPRYYTGALDPFMLFDKIPIIIIMSGVALLVYGVKRIIDVVTRLLVKKPQ